MLLSKRKVVIILLIIISIPIIFSLTGAVIHNIQLKHIHNDFLQLQSENANLASTDYRFGNVWYDIENERCEAELIAIYTTDNVYNINVTNHKLSFLSNTEQPVLLKFFNNNFYLLYKPSGALEYTEVKLNPLFDYTGPYYLVTSAFASEYSFSIESSDIQYIRSLLTKIDTSRPVYLLRYSFIGTNWLDIYSDFRCTEG